MTQVENKYVLKYMSLRVLLADESSTIKKVMQLALQDYGVDVKSVPIGIDVHQVCKAFQPDIIFVDILLAKKNGYEVSAELKSDPLLRKIPVIMMWSGFMELDEDKARHSQIDDRLEKPFDADMLRDIVKKWVPKTQGNIISQFISFPEMPDIVEPIRSATPNHVLKEQPSEEHALSNLKPHHKESHSKDLSHTHPHPEKGPISLSPHSKKSLITDLADDVIEMADLDEPEEFQRVPLPKSRENDNKDPQGIQSPSQNLSLQSRIQKNRSTLTANESESDHLVSPLAGNRNPSSKGRTFSDWDQEDLGRFKLEIPPEENFKEIDAIDLTKSSIAMSSGVEDISIDDISNPQPSKNSIHRDPIDLDSELEEINLEENISSSRQAPQKTENHPSSLPKRPHSPPGPSVSLKENYEHRPPAVDAQRAEEIIKAEARIVLENIAWKIIPDIVERIVREELHKILRDAEKL